MSANTDGAAQRGPFKMTITLNVLEHLGENLYSSTPAVLSEVVANAWDADAGVVEIDIDIATQEIVIRDDGSGMTQADVNAKFLTIGYPRRGPGGDGAVTAKGRHVMGRKGIGKLSLFAIARAVEIHTVREVDGIKQRSALLLRKDDIRDCAESNEEYFPEPLPHDLVDFDQGTRIVLRELDRKATAITTSALRRRLARRFSIIGAESDFVVRVDGDEIGIDDRDYFESVQYLWSIGDVGDTFEKLAVNAERTARLSGLVDEDKGWEITGWVGTLDEHKSVEEGNDVVVLLAWGKLIQEDLLRDIKAGGLYSKYLIGELRADFLDLDDQPDIATSDRQRLKETDPRYEQIREWFRDQILAEVARNWRNWRRKSSVDQALRDPAIKEWYETLDGADDKNAATRLLGRIGTVMRDRETDRDELYRHTILAFETLRVRRALSLIEELPEDADVAAFGPVFAHLDQVEAAEYHRIAKARLEVIERFRDIAPDEKEKVIQQYLFDHLWLLHPSWERPTGNPQIEKAVYKEWAKLDAKLTEEEKRGRVDIRYRTAAGKHVIVELKKASVNTNVFDLGKQMEKYRGALEKVLQAKFDIQNPDIEVIALVGTMPGGTSAERREDLLGAINGRALTYDSLIDEALASYSDYLAANERIGKLAEILERVGAETEADSAEDAN